MTYEHLHKMAGKEWRTRVNSSLSFWDPPVTHFFTNYTISCTVTRLYLWGKVTVMRFSFQALLDPTAIAVFSVVLWNIEHCGEGQGLQPRVGYGAPGRFGLTGRGGALGRGGQWRHQEKGTGLENSTRWPWGWVSVSTLGSLLGPLETKRKITHRNGKSALSKGFPKDSHCFFGITGQAYRLCLVCVCVCVRVCTHLVRS